MCVNLLLAGGSRFFPRRVATLMMVAVGFNPRTTLQPVPFVA
jgi:hypothetical protein